MNENQALSLLHESGGYYEQPPGGPLVGYAGRDPTDGKQFVGRIYANFAAIEARGRALFLVARALYQQSLFSGVTPRVSNFCGAPEGGKALAVMLSVEARGTYIFPEKKIIEVGTKDSREKSKLVWGRHEPTPGQSYWIVEDVCNNFSTTKDMIKLIEGQGAKVVGVLAFLNRSMEFDQFFPYEGRNLPIVVVVRKEIEQFRQSDPEVADEIAAGNVAWTPKDRWPELMAAMAQAK